MITVVLTIVFTWSLFYGQIPLPYLLVISAGFGIFIAIINRHRHEPFISIDVFAQSSRLKNINPLLKFWTLLALMIISVTSKNIFTGIFLLVTAGVFAVPVGGLDLRHYIHILALPVSFLLIGGLALLFEISHQPAGVLNLNIFGLWFCVSAAAQARTALIVSRAFGAVSCLCLIGLTTPMPDIIGVMRKVHCPELIIDLMYLIYRYIFILLSLHHEMRDAAKSRLGFRDYKTSIRATAQIYANLLGRSYQFADKNFDAMESRCYDTGIVFLETKNKISIPQVFASAALVIISLGISLLPL